MTTAYEILTGPGRIYVAAVGTTMPVVNVTPNASWTDLGETDGGVKVTTSQKLEFFRTDQRTGPAKAIRSEEDVIVETKLAQATLENLAKFLGKTLTDTAAGSGTIGTRDVTLYRGADVSEYAVCIRGNGPYGSGYSAQFQLPRAVFDGNPEHEMTRTGRVLYGMKLQALEDLNASSAGDRFGKLITQDAAAL